MVLCPRKYVEFLILQEQFSGEVNGKTSFPEKMDPLWGLGEQLGVPNYTQEPALSTRFDGATRVQPLANILLCLVPFPFPAL